jgi:hypothetical protein
LLAYRPELTAPPYPNSTLTLSCRHFRQHDFICKPFPSDRNQQPTTNKHMRTPHTPGPWATSPYNNVISRNGTIAKLEQMPSNDDSERCANAKLISAAPELLEALEFLLADWIAINGDRLTGSRVPAEKAIAAIQKAKL